MFTHFLKTLMLFAVTFISCKSAFTQTHYNTYFNDNYSGSIGGIIQPASIVDNRYEWQSTLGGNFSLSNNFDASNFNNLVYGSQNQKNFYRQPIGKGYHYRSFEIVPISFIYQLTDKDAIGYSWRVRTFTNYDGMEDPLTEWQQKDFVNLPAAGVVFNQGRLSYQYMQWSEHTINYARTIIDERRRVLKGGIGIKILNGIDAHQLFTEGGEVTLNQNGFANFDGMNFSYGRSNQRQQLNNSNLGVGFDIGAIFEYRPEYKKFYYEMDKVKRNPSKHLNKYKYKAGVSITNIGGIKYSKDTNTYSFVNANNHLLNITALNSAGFNSSGGSPNYIDQNVLPNTTKNQNSDTTFRMSLPTALNVQFDYHLKNYIYVNYSGSLPIWFKGDDSKVHDLMIHTVSARYEHRDGSIGLPISIQRNGQINLGLYGAIRKAVKKNTYSFFIGANNINNLLGQRKIYNTNIYAGVSIGRLYTKPLDRDNDLISDPKDLCPTDSGSYKMKGCPDVDNDKIPDYKDFCPYDFGPKKYNGCPDTDGDGILDYEDHCPNKKGLRANNGCPDTDKDGIIDTTDRCPFIPGVWENNGCPMEQVTCCLDSDGDGLNDKIDSCAYLPGPADNFGCPLNKVDFKNGKEDYETIKRKNIDRVIDETKEQIEDKTVKEVLEDLSTIDYLNIYFEVDKDKIQSQYDEKIRGFADKINQNGKVLILILGHTDSDGSAEYNLKLSAKRSLAAKKRLMKLGVPENRIVIKNYGEEKPAEENDTTKQKSKNRRVEVRMMNIHS